MGERRLQETHFLELPDACNLYSLARVRHEGCLKVLVATRSRLYCAQLMESAAGVVEWQSVVLPLLPEGAEIVSLDAFNQIAPNRPPVIGITILAASNLIEKLAGEPSSATASATTTSSGQQPSLPPQSPQLEQLQKQQQDQQQQPGSGETEQQASTAASPPPEKSFYLLLYGWSCSEEDSWDKIAANRQIVKLEFVPFILSHQEMEFPGGVASVFLLSGSDNRLHLYKKFPEGGFHELLGSKYLPTMTTSYPSSVISLDTEVFGTMGVLAVGCQDGTVQVISKQEGITKQWSINLDGPISSLKIYKSDKVVAGDTQRRPRRQALSLHPFVRALQERIAKSTLTTTDSSESTLTAAAVPPSAATTPQFEVNVIVGATIGYAIVFRNILELGFTDYHFLPDSDKNDAVLAVGLADADFDHDGHTEILVGTHGRKLLVYKEMPRSTPTEAPSSDGPHEIHLGVVATSHEARPTEPRTPTSSDSDSEYRLVWQRQFVYPIFDFLSDDWTGDGINDLVVCSKFGVHLMQSDLAVVRDKALRRLDLLAEIVTLEQEIGITSSQESGVLEK